MIDRISNLTTSVQNTYQLQQMQTQINTLTNQISAGKLANPAASLGSGASLLYQLQFDNDQQTTLQTTMTSASDKLTAMQTALTSVASVATSISKSALDNNVVSSSGYAVVATQAQDALSQVISLLNTQYSGQSLFSGADGSTAPMASASAITDAVQSVLTTQVAANGGTALTAANVAALTGGTNTGNNGIANFFGDANTASVTAPSSGTVPVSYQLNSSAAAAGLSNVSVQITDPSVTAPAPASAATITYHLAGTSAAAALTNLTVQITDSAGNVLASLPASSAATSVNWNGTTSTTALLATSTGPLATDTNSLANNTTASLTAVGVAGTAATTLGNAAIITAVGNANTAVSAANGTAVTAKNDAAAAAAAPTNATLAATAVASAKAAVVAATAANTAASAANTAAYGTSVAASTTALLANTASAVVAATSVGNDIVAIAVPGSSYTATLVGTDANGNTQTAGSTGNVLATIPVSGTSGATTWNGATDATDTTGTTVTAGKSYTATLVGWTPVGTTGASNTTSSTVTASTPIAYKFVATDAPGVFTNYGVQIKDTTTGKIVNTLAVSASPASSTVSWNGKDGNGVTLSTTDSYTATLVGLTSQPAGSTAANATGTVPGFSGTAFLATPGTSSMKVLTGANSTTSYNLTGNSQAFRDLLQGLSQLSLLGSSQLDATAKQAILTQASTTIRQAQTELTTAQGVLGATQTQITTAVTAQKSAATATALHITSLVANDPATDITQLDALQTQLQASYEVTAAIAKLSFVSYMPSL